MTQCLLAYPKTMFILTGIVALVTYLVVSYTTVNEEFTDKGGSSQIAVVSNDVDALPANWIQSVSENIGTTPSCGNVELRPKLGDAMAGFYPKGDGGGSIKNCNIGESLTVSNKLTGGGGVQQMVSCRITPKRSFTCDSDQLSSGTCTFPPYLYSGTYGCTSAKPSIKEPPYEFQVVVNNNKDNVYTDRGPTVDR